MASLFASIFMWILLALLLGILLTWLWMRGRAKVSPEEWEDAQAKISRAENERAAAADERVRLNADIDERTRRIGDLQTSLRDVEAERDRLAEGTEAADDDGPSAADASRAPAVACCSPTPTSRGRARCSCGRAT